MLVRWCLDVVLMSRVLQLTVIWGADIVSLVPQNVSFGMPVASTLAPWGIIERCRGTWEHKNRDWGPGLDFCIWDGFRDPFQKFLAMFWEQSRFLFSSFFPGHIFKGIRGPNLDVLRF